MANKPFLKWAGGKTRVAPHILPHLGGRTRLVEPFAGSCALFLQSDLEAAVMADVNPDLIRLYTTLKIHGTAFIDWVEHTYFTPANNTQEQFMANRELFNSLKDLPVTATNRENWARSALFIYLNRHAFNGMCRYNKSGGYNVPYGKYKAPYFPRVEMEAFAQRAQTMTFKCQSFVDTMLEEIAMARPDTVLYCDPPYIELSKTASFTAYATDGFPVSLQETLAQLAWQASQAGIRVLVSNHDVTPARNLYEHGLTFTGDSPLNKSGRADAINSFDVRRSISAKGANRGTAPELLAIYTGSQSA